MSKKKDPILYDENGHWVQERNRIKGAIRRAFRLSPQMKEVLQAARVELPPALKKDGTPGKRPQVRYKCAMCGKLFSQKNVNVDHIETVVPLWRHEKDMTYDEIVRGIFCEKDNLQVLCCTPMKKNDGKPSCHKKKTDEEKYIRKQWDLLNNKKSLRPCGAAPPDIIDRHNKWKEEYQTELKEKEKKKNERKKRKPTKRKRNSKSNKKD